VIKNHKPTPTIVSKQAKIVITKLHPNFILKNIHIHGKNPNTTISINWVLVSIHNTGASLSAKTKFLI